MLLFCVWFHIDIKILSPKQFLLNSRNKQTEELSRDVKNINSAYVKEIETLKSCIYHGDSLNNSFEIQGPKTVLKKCASSLQKMIPSNCFQYQVDGNDDNGTIDTEFTGDKCEKIFEREIDENTIKSNNDTIDKLVVNDEHHLYSCHTSSKTSSNVKNNKQKLNSDEIKLMSLLESVENSRLYQYRN